MINAYKAGQDLYAVIGQGMYHNKYEDNLEFYPEGTEIELDGKKIICGKKTHLHEAGKKRRSSAKTMLLAATYGMSGRTAGIRMGYKDEKGNKEATREGTKLLDGFFNSFPEVKKAIDYSKETLKAKKYVEDWAGRRRHLPEIDLEPYEVSLKNQTVEESNFNPFLNCKNRETEDPLIADWKEKIRKAVERSNNYQTKQAASEGRIWVDNDEVSNTTYEKMAREAYKEGVIIKANTGRRAQAERQCFNARIQGGAASLTKLAMVNIEKDPRLNELDTHLIITVHDEVLVECPALYADEVEQRLPQIMIDTAKPYINVPMQCDPYNVDRWYVDTYTVDIQEEFKELEEKMDKEKALAIMYNNHPELDRNSIYNTCTTGAELVI